jgi:hypothetical protein
MLVFVLIAAAIVLGLAGLTAAVLLYRAFGGYSDRPLPPVLEETRAALGLTRCTGRWVPPSCAGEVDGARVVMLTGPRATAGGDVMVQAVEVLVDTGLHPGMSTRAVPGTGLAERLPRGVVLQGGISLLKGSGADLAIRACWPSGWDTLYLRGAPAPGKVTTASLEFAVHDLLALRRALIAPPG